MSNQQNDIYNEYMEENKMMILTKVAIIRKPGYPKGITAPCYLNCPCGAKPETNIDNQENVKCVCDQEYDYKGYVINEKN